MNKEGKIVDVSSSSFLTRKVHPGSILKIVISYALIGEPYFSPSFRVYSREWRRKVNLVEAIAFSSMDYFKYYLNRMDREKIVKAGYELGLFPDTIGMEVDLERNPLVYTDNILRMMRRIALGNNMDPYRRYFIVEGMKGSVEYGTSRNDFLYSLRVAGKTGTSTYTSSWRTYGLFAGFFPYDTPEYIFLFYVDRGNGRKAVKEAERYFKRWFR